MKVRARRAAATVYPLVVGNEGGTYRDEIAAAHERIADLQQQLEQQRAESEASASEAAEPFISSLKAQRDKIFVDARKYRGFGTDGLRVMRTVALIFCGLPLYLAVFGTTTESFVGKMLLVLGAVLTVMGAFAVRSDSDRRARDKAAPIDEKIADIQRTVAIARGAQRARVLTDSGAAPPVRVALESDEVLAEDESHGEARTRARRS